MQFFRDYVATLDIPSAQKEVLLDRKMIQSHHLYLNLMSYLSPAYPNIMSEQLDKLSLGSYLYFRFLLSFDNMMDSVKIGGSKMAMFAEMSIAFEFYEKSMRELSALYPENEYFWQSFKQVKKLYFETMAAEKKISAQKSAFTQELFNKIAAGKSAVCFAAVYSLGALNGSNPHQETLLECLKELHIGLQYIDDIDDFKKDIAEGQWTYPQYLIQEYLQEKDIIITDTVLLHKHLYLSGIAQNLLGLATKHYANSVALAREAGVYQFADFLDKQREMCHFHLGEIENLLIKTQVKATKSQQAIEKNTLEEAINLALGYVGANLTEDYEWSDFLTSAGQGATWTTAYVGMQLAEINNQYPSLKEVLNKLYAKRNHSFNDTVMQDGDSTNFLVGFANAMTGSVPAHILERWLVFMNENGGWVTYRNEQELRQRLELSEQIGVKGWTDAQTCVTAAAAYVMASMPALEAEYKKTCQYLKTELAHKNHWSSYWWTSDVYATAFAMLALKNTENYIETCKEPANWLASQQHQDGYWLNPKGNETSALYTALAIKTLLVYDAKQFNESIEKGVEWLLKTQTEDGSWLTNRVLRIPATDITNPEAVTLWRKSSFGVNCLVDDHNRLFTTSTVINTLYFYSKRQS
jgi:hypothetical protein